MEYVSGTAALNLGPRDVTPGDWHYSSVDWEKPLVLDTEGSPFGVDGLYETEVPLRGQMLVAGHVRACLDLISQGYYSSAQGMRENFISNEAFTPIVLEHVSRLIGSDSWSLVDRFMGREYGMDWLRYKRSMEREKVLA